MDTTVALKLQKPGTDKLLPGLHFQTLDAKLALLLEKGALPSAARPSADAAYQPPVPAIAYVAIRGVS